MTEKTKKWDDEAVATLMSIVGNTSPVSAEAVEQAAETLGVTTRSVAAKLRNMDVEVASMAKAKVPAFNQEEGEALAAFVNSNAGQYTYKDIAEKFAGGKFNAKQVQGKILALELTGNVKPAEKIEEVRKYSDAEEVKFVEMCNSGASIEDIASAMGRELASVRGKALSLVRKGTITKIPAQAEKHSKEQVDPIEALGADIADMTVEQIAKAVDKTVRGVRTILTRRSLDCADYKGKAKKEKAEAKNV